MSKISVGYDPMVGPRSTGDVAGSGTPSAPSTPHRSTTFNRNSGNALVPSIYDRNLHRGKKDISLSSLSFLFMHIVQSNLSASSSLIQMERRLNNLGYGVGVRVLELASLRENFNNSISSSGKSNTARRQVQILEMLQFVGDAVWRSLFDKPADNLERSSENDHQYMIIDNEPLLSRFVCVPKEYEGLSCEAFVAGIVEGVLDVSYFACEVSAHSVPSEEFPNKTVYLINLDAGVVKREERIK